MQVINTNGFKLEVEGETVVAVEHGQYQFKIGQAVVSSRRSWIPDGTPGVIVAIGYPYENGRTSDILDVKFEGCEPVIPTKFKYLLSEEGRSL